MSRGEFVLGVCLLSALLVGNRIDDPLQKVGSSSPVLACKNTATPLGGMDVGRSG